MQLNIILLSGECYRNLLLPFAPTSEADQFGVAIKPRRQAGSAYDGLWGGSFGRDRHF
jgi:hypothetical protein